MFLPVNEPGKDDHNRQTNGGNDVYKFNSIFWYRECVRCNSRKFNDGETGSHVGNQKIYDLAPFQLLPEFG